MSPSTPVLSPFPDMLSGWFWSLWAAVVLWWRLMPVLAALRHSRTTFPVVPDQWLWWLLHPAQQSKRITGQVWRDVKKLGNYCGLVLAYRYLPIELNWIIRWFQGSPYGELTCLNATDEHIFEINLLRVNVQMNKCIASKSMRCLCLVCTLIKTCLA